MRQYANMQNIALPKKTEFIAGSVPSEGRVIVEPLYPGYGMTLGNSLRRVLLSSLTGAAVIGVKIKGVSHEFTTLKGVKDDIMEMILNLKQLRLKIYTDEEVVLHLQAKGKKVVTAAEIDKNSDVKIVNTDLVVATLTDDSAVLDMEIIVKGDRGYKMSEGSKKENELGFIEIDSLFSPILSVSIDVVNTRVGKMTNWDKLILDIKTDGTIDPQDAFKESVKILVDQFSALNFETEAAPAPESEIVPEEEAVAEKPAVDKVSKKKTKKIIKE
jgi:DNA-directed RNA polymerase subunit alpha